MKKKFAGFVRGNGFACLLAAILILSISFNASAGQNKKKNKNTDTSTQPAATTPPVSGPDSAQIDNDIGEMLAAFQLGNVDMMHKYYSDNVTFVSGNYEPPISGWQNYVPLYQRQRGAFQGMQITRRNTEIFIHADVAWAAYQWEFDALLNGAPYAMRGQTTLVLNKVGDNWLIVHNHTSEIYPTAPAPAATAAPASSSPSKP